ncbi:MAG: transposase [Pseudomonadota bacterium]
MPEVLGFVAARLLDLYGNHPQRELPRKILSFKWVKAGQTVGAVAKESGLIEQTLHKWVKALEAGKRAGARPVKPQQIEPSRVRAENVRLKREKEIVKKAAAYFAPDALCSAPRSTRIGKESASHHEKAADRCPPAGNERVERLMRENTIRGRFRGCIKAMTDPKHSLPVAPKLLEHESSRLLDQAGD